MSGVKFYDKKHLRQLTPDKPTPEAKNSIPGTARHTR
jgi:hypothetical protein